MSDETRKTWRLGRDIPALLIGVQILTKGWAKLPDFEHHPLLVSFLLLAGVFVIVGSMVTVWLEKRIAHAHALFHAAEGMAIAVSAIILFEKGKLRMPLLLLLVGCAYLLVGFLESRTDIRQKERLAALVQSIVGWAFILAGVLLAGFTATGDHDVWALGTSFVLAVTGVILLLVRRRTKVPRERSA